MFWFYTGRGVGPKSRFQLGNRDRTLLNYRFSVVWISARYIIVNTLNNAITVSQISVCSSIISVKRLNLLIFKIVGYSGLIELSATSVRLKTLYSLQCFISAKLFLALLFGVRLLFFANPDLSSRFYDDAMMSRRTLLHLSGCVHRVCRISKLFRISFSYLLM